jgi:hypothetical protein
MNKLEILQAFNNHFFEFVEDIQNVFPNDADIMVTKLALSAVRKLNPKMIIKIWYEYIANKYNDQIEIEELSFFIDKDYSHDLTDLGSSSANNIMSKIDVLREPIRNMGEENQQKSMKYIKNLSKLSKIYNL